MNLMKFLPKRIRNNYEKDLVSLGNKNPQEFFSKLLVASLIISFVVALIVYIFKRLEPSSFYFVLFSFLGVFLIIHIIAYFNISLNASKRVKKMEKVFPDFIGLMSSNLRAGMTVETAFLSSIRPELDPLDKEIKEMSKEIATGKSMVSAFEKMSKRIDSDKISKIISLIVSGLRTGGNISTLLQTTATNMREKEYLERKASSNVLMYVIFIFVAVGIGGPLLFGLSSVLVEIIIELTGQLPEIETGQMEMPFTMKGVDISLSFIIYFSVAFILITNIISSFLLGLVNEGNEKYGLKYIIPMVILSMAVFFLTRILLSSVLMDSFFAI